MMNDWGSKSNNNINISVYLNILKLIKHQSEALDNCEPKQFDAMYEPSSLGYLRSLDHHFKINRQLYREILSRPIIDSKSSQQHILIGRVVHYLKCIFEKKNTNNESLPGMGP